MADVLAPFVVVLIALLLTRTMQRGRPGSETRAVWLGFLAHVLASGAQYLLTLYYYGGGDMFFYARTGASLARLLEYDFSQFGVEVLRLMFHQEAFLPVEVIGAGSSTGTMCAVAGLLLVPMGGSVIAVALLLSMAAFASRVVLLRVFLQELPAKNHAALRTVILLLPSVTFWGATIAKETIVLIALGPLAMAAHRLASGQVARRAPLVIVATLAVGAIWLVKPYVVVAFAAGAAVWWYTRALKFGGSRISRLQLFVGVLVGVGAVWGLGQVLPEFSVDAISARAAHLQAVGEVVQGGSSYEIGSSEARSGAAQAAFVPVALFYALFRPFIFEARNPLMFLNSLETTWVAYLVFRSLQRGRLAGLMNNLREHPLMAFSFVFVLLMGVGVGLATTNLGTLTRYRVPMMPFYAAFLVVWGARREYVKQVTDLGPVREAFFARRPPPRGAA